MKKTRFRIMAVLCAALMALTLFGIVPMPAAAAGNTYYVDDVGTNGDGSIGSPWNDLYSAVGQLTAGDKLYVRAGTYLMSEQTLSLDSTAGSPTTIEAYPGEVPVISPAASWIQNPFSITGDYWTLKGLKFTGWNNADNPEAQNGGQVIYVGASADYAVLDGLVIDQNQETAIAAVGATNLTIQNCDITNNAQCYYFGGNNVTGGVLLSSVKGATVTGNRIFKTTGPGIQVCDRANTGMGAVNITNNWIIRAGIDWTGGGRESLWGSGIFVDAAGANTVPMVYLWAGYNIIVGSRDYAILSIGSNYKYFAATHNTTYANGAPTAIYNSWNGSSGKVGILWDNIVAQASSANVYFGGALGDGWGLNTLTTLTAAKFLEVPTAPNYTELLGARKADNSLPVNGVHPYFQLASDSPARNAGVGGTDYAANNSWVWNNTATDASAFGALHPFLDETHLGVGTSVDNGALVYANNPTREPTSVSLNKSSTTVGSGLTETLTATVLPSEAVDKTVTWSSSDENVATVSSGGVVTGVAAGTVTITATTNTGGLTASCVVTVTQSVVNVTGVNLNKSSTTITFPATEQLTATLVPSEPSNPDVTWSSSDQTVATVSNAGLVTSLKVGTATITVTTVDGGFTATCDVTVVAPVASTYYVDGTNGDDNNDGSVSTPFASLGKAVEVADINDTIVMRTGSYAIASTTLAANGTSLYPITLKSYDGEVVSFWNSFGSNALTITGDAWHIKGLTFTNFKSAQNGGAVIKATSAASDLVIENCVVSDSTVTGINLTDVVGAQIINTDVTGCGNYAAWGCGTDFGGGIHVDGGRDLLITGCRVIYNAGAGIYIKGQIGNTLVTLNQVGSNGNDPQAVGYLDGTGRPYTGYGTGSGMHFAGTMAAGTKLQISKNVFALNNQYGLKVIGGTTVSVGIMQNTSYSNTEGGLYAEGTSKGSFLNNLSTESTSTNFGGLMNSFMYVPNSNSLISPANISSINFYKVPNTHCQNMLSAARKADGSLPYTGILYLKSGSVAQAQSWGWNYDYFYPNMHTYWSGNFPNAVPYWTSTNMATSTNTGAYAGYLVDNGAYQIVDTKILVDGVSLDTNTASIAAGNTQQLTATVSPADATVVTVTWTSSNEAVATVSNTGLVTAVAEGVATITVTTTDGSFTATCDVTVTSGGEILSIDLWVADVDGNGMYVDNSNIRGLYDGLILSDFLAGITLADGVTVVVYDALGNQIVDDPTTITVTAGMKLEVYKNEVLYKTFNLLLRGDINADGFVDILDYFFMIEYMLEVSAIPDNLLSAADLNMDQSADILDYFLFIEYMLEVTPIDQFT